MACISATNKSSARPWPTRAARRSGGRGDVRSHPNASWRRTRAAADLLAAAKAAGARLPRDASDPHYSVYARVQRAISRTFIRSLARTVLPVHSICVGSSFVFGHKRSGNVALLQQLGRPSGLSSTASPPFRSTTRSSAARAFAKPCDAGTSTELTNAGPGVCAERGHRSWR